MDARKQIEEFLASPLSRWKPWATPDGRSPQLDFMKASNTHRVRILRGGNRSGKSSAGAADHALIACGWHPYFKRSPTRGWIVALDWRMGIGQVIWPKLKKLLPMSQIRSISWIQRAEPEIPSAIVLKNGSEIHMKSAESGREKLQGVDLDWCWIDEEIDGSLVEEIRARLIDRGGLLSITLTPVARQPWILDVESEVYEGKATTKVVRASMIDAAEAGILDKQAVHAYLSTLPERQRRVRELGDFAQLEGLVYQEYSKATHCLRPHDHQLVDAQGRYVAPWPLPASWPRWASMDFGYSVPAAVVVICEDPYTGRWFVEKCLYSAGLRMSQWIPILRKELPKLEHPLITDHDAMERAELSAAGIPTTKAIKHVTKSPGIEAVQRALMPMLEGGDGRPRLQFVLWQDSNFPTNWMTGRTDCHHLDWEIGRYRYVKKQSKSPDAADPKDEPLKKDDHLCFPAGTKIETAQGAVSIEDLAGGTFEARCVDPATGQWALSEALAVETSESDLVTVTWDGGETTCTPDHPFLTPGGWKRADALVGMSVLCDTIGAGGTDGPGSDLGDVPVVHGSPLLPVREILHGHGQSASATTPASSGLDREQGRDPGRLRHSPQERESFGQPAGESRVHARVGACLASPSDADRRGTSGEAGARRQACRSRGQRVAQERGGGGVAQAAWQGFVEEPQLSRTGVRDMPEAVQDARCQAGDEVLLGSVPGSGAARTGSAAGAQALLAGQVWSTDAKGALSELARQGNGALPLAPRRVRAVRPAGRGRVYSVHVRGAHNFVADRALVANCDALRYLIYFLERKGNSGGGEVPLLTPKPSPFNDTTPPSPWK